MKRFCRSSACRGGCLALATFVVALAAPAPAAEIRLGVEFARPGEVASLRVVLNSQGDAVAGFQNDIVFDPRTAIATRGGAPDCDVNPDIERDGTNFAFVDRPCAGESCERLRAVVFSFSSLDPIADGALLYTCRVRVAADAIEGAYPLFCPTVDVEVADPDGGIVPSTCGEGAIVVRRSTPLPGETPVYDPEEPRRDGLPCEDDDQCVSLACITRVCGGAPGATPTPTATSPAPPPPTPTRGGAAPTATAVPEATRGLPTPQAAPTNTPFPDGAGGCAATPAGGGALALLWPLALVPLVGRGGRAVAALALAIALTGCGDGDSGSPGATATALPTATAAAPTPTATDVATPSPLPSASPMPPRTATQPGLPSATATRAAPSATPTPTEPPSATPTATFAGVAGDPLSGGATTVFDTTRNAYGQPARNLPLALRTDFFVGNAFFNRNWVTAPSSNTGLDGLGPVFNARSCSSCHLHDGRGRPPLSADEPPVSLLFRLSVPGEDELGAPLAEPTYGGQLGPLGILGVPGEGGVRVSYEEVAGEFADGDTYSLRRPRYEFVDLAFGPLVAAALFSPRVGPAVFGAGLLEAIPEAAIVAGEDADDRDGDEVSGRANRVWDRRRGVLALGRFGWKANVPTVEQQTAGAFLGDIGLTSELFPEEDCPAPQSECAAAPNGGSPELDADKVDSVTFYMRRLAVPARRDVTDAAALRGEELFAEIGCASCHTPTWTTGTEAPPELAGQVIHPYTDLLLHDMGEGLADGRPDFAATGREWRTPPLWGLGLLHTVNGHNFLLHDGRARGAGEAILWHDGEAAAARDRFRELPRADRAALLRFLDSL